MFSQKCPTSSKQASSPLLILCAMTRGPANQTTCAGWVKVASSTVYSFTIFVGGILEFLTACGQLRFQFVVDSCNNQVVSWGQPPSQTHATRCVWHVAIVVVVGFKKHMKRKGRNTLPIHYATFVKDFFVEYRWMVVLRWLLAIFF